MINSDKERLLDRAEEVIAIIDNEIKKLQQQIEKDKLTVDRMEKSLTSDNSAVQDAFSEFGIKVYSIVIINDIIKAIEDGIVAGKEYLPAMKQYRADYGVEY